MTKASKPELLDANSDKLNSGSSDLGEQSVNHLVNRQLDHEVDQVSPKIASQLQAIREKALKTRVKRPSTVFNQLHSWLSMQTWLTFKSMSPIGLAVCLAILVNYLNQPANELVDVVAVQPIPAELLTASVPTEDLALLQDLEFAIWLSEQGETTSAPNSHHSSNTNKEVVL